MAVLEKFSNREVSQRNRVVLFDGRKRVTIFRINESYMLQSFKPLNDAYEIMLT